MSRCNELDNQEKRLVTTLCKALPYMSDFDKGFFWGRQRDARSGTWPVSRQRAGRSRWRKEKKGEEEHEENEQR